MPVIAPQATPDELVTQESVVPFVPKIFPLFPVWSGRTLVGDREVIQAGLEYEPVERMISAVVTPLTATVDNDPPEMEPPEIVAPLIDTKPLSCPPVINTLLADWVAIVPRPETSEVEIPNKVLTWDPVNATGAAEDPVLFPIIELAARLAILPKVTAPLAIVAANDPVPDPVTSLVKVIVWSPVFVPLDVPEKLDADIVPSTMTLATWEVVELRILSVLVVAPVKSNIVFPPEKVIVGVVPEKVIGVADDKVKAVAVEAPRPVTDENVSASVAERFNVPPRDTLPPPERIPLLLMVTEELLRLELLMLDKVFDAPEIVKPEAVPAIVTPLICPPVRYILLAD